MELSVVIPARNEAPNVAPLVAEIRAALDGRLDYEIVYIDDGSSDETAAAVGALRRCARVRLLRHAKSCGQSAAVRTGVNAARRPGSQRSMPTARTTPPTSALWELARATPARTSCCSPAFARSGATPRQALLLAHRQRRARVAPERPHARYRLRPEAAPARLYLALPFFDHNHRFLPALVLREGGIVESVAVNHRPRERGNIQLRHLRPAVGRHHRSLRRHVAAAPRQNAELAEE